MPRRPNETVVCPYSACGPAGLYFRKKRFEFGGVGNRIQGGCHGIEWPPCKASAVKDCWTRSNMVFILPVLFVSQSRVRQGSETSIRMG